MVPIFNGLGYAMIVVRFFVNIYYVVITAWSLYYLVIGFQSTLPWGSCTAEWSTFECYTKTYEEDCQRNQNSTDYTWYMKKCVTYDEYCLGHGGREYDIVNNVSTILFKLSSLNEEN